MSRPGGDASTIGGASVGDEAKLSTALHLRSQELSLREVAAKLVITKGTKKGEHPSPPRSWLTTSVS